MSESHRAKIVRIIARLNVGGPAKHVVWLTSGLADYETVLVAGSVPQGEGDMGYFAEEPPLGGYMRERDYNPRVAPVENVGEVEGYYRPRTINPAVDSFRPAEDAPKPSSSWFRSPWQ